MTTPLAQQHCQPISRGTAALDAATIATLLPQIPQWMVAADSTSLSREFRFRDFYATVAFVNAVAWIAHQQDHHPDLQVGYNRCRITWRTHAVGGLSLNDFICAARTDNLEAAA
ncbi:4a-hydroxytetrahydrobiopterin dehydratase [Sulfurivermis fontis]|uniref:4a-hydroxytetrahydrobiopterin dehydratase n=1 Tax=Sulfurivermis fontis TaxID=1972068 RepID=UPI000FD71477|nr:4a-hydroxytetrahydrobiopterin dehydratase [Sulfurivermis fontis]